MQLNKIALCAVFKTSNKRQKGKENRYKVTGIPLLQNQSFEIGIRVYDPQKLGSGTRALCHNLFWGFKQLLGS